MTTTYYTQYFFILLLFLFILITVLLTFGMKKKYKQKEETQPTHKSKPSKKPKSDEVIDTLDWMLANGIIDSKTYNDLMVKSMPHF